MWNILRKFLESISENCYSNRNDKMFWVKSLLYFRSNDFINAIFLSNFPNSIFCKPSVGGLVVVVHCSETVFWNGDIALLPNGRTLGKSTMKLLILDTACVVYGIWYGHFGSTFPRQYISKCISTQKLQMFKYLYALLFAMEYIHV
jgi:hypothetical protein